MYDGSGLFDNGVGDGQYAAGSEFSGCLGDGVLRQFGDADGLRLQQWYGNVVKRHDGHQPGNAESDADDQLYSDVYDADRFSYYGSGHGDGVSAGQPDGQPDISCQLNSGYHFGPRLYKRYADLVDGSG